MSYDLHLENAPSTSKFECLSFGDYLTPLGVQGVSKLVTRFVKCFFTPKGSDISDPNYGTTLMQYVGGVGNTSDLAMLASQAVNETVEKIREYDSLYTLADEERLVTADILSLSPTTEGDGVDIYVSLRNVAGTTAKFCFPLKLSE